MDPMTQLNAGVRNVEAEAQRVKVGAVGDAHWVETRANGWANRHPWLMLAIGAGVGVGVVCTVASGLL